MIPPFSGNAAPYLIGLATGPILAKIAKPLLRGTIKVAVGAALQVKQLAVEAGEELQDIAAEASVDMAAAGAGRPAVPATAPKTEPRTGSSSTTLRKP